MKITCYFAQGLAFHIGTTQGHQSKDYPRGPPSLGFGNFPGLAGGTGGEAAFGRLFTAPQRSMTVTAAQYYLLPALDAKIDDIHP